MKTRPDIEVMTPNQLVSWFMIGCYAYYVLDKQVMLDQDFDYLVLKLKEQWDFADHYHKKYITSTHLNAMTGYDIHYPNIVKHSTYGYLEELNEIFS